MRSPRTVSPAVRELLVLLGLILRMGFAKEAESISYKTQWFHIICGFVVVGLVLLIVLAPAAFVFLSIFPGYWGAAAGLVLVAGVIWFARWGIR